jgi:hypothetical protein
MPQLDLNLDMKHRAATAQAPRHRGHARVTCADGADLAGCG